MNATSINDLPTDPAGGGSIGGNVAITMVASESSSSDNQGLSQSGAGGSSLSLDQTTINQIVNGLQQASLSGATNLPSRDIPRTTEPLTQDAYVQPNFVPPPPAQYINNDETNETILYNYNNREASEQKLDSIYNEIQTPLLLIIMYFLFQLGLNLFLQLQEVNFLMLLRQKR